MIHEIRRNYRSAGGGAPKRLLKSLSDGSSPISERLNHSHTTQFTPLFFDFPYSCNTVRLREHDPVVESLQHPRYPKLGHRRIVLTTTFSLRAVSYKFTRAERTEWVCEAWLGVSDTEHTGSTCGNQNHHEVQA